MADGALGETEKKLYRRDFSMPEDVVIPDLKPERHSLSSDWGKIRKDEEELTKTMARPKTSVFFKLLIASFGFFIISIIAGLFLFIGGTNTVSGENVDISILGPLSIGGGEELSFQVVVTNNNSTPLELADLVIYFPAGTHEAGNPEKELPRLRTSLGTIRPGESVNEIVRAVLFGEEKEEKNIIVGIEYRLEGSNAIFAKETPYALSVSSAPVTLSLSLLNEVNANQQMDVIVTVVSNASERIENLLMTMEYPFGFEPSSSNPAPSFGNRIWDIGDLDPGAKREIRIRGIIKGQDNEAKIFRASVGKKKESDEREIATVYSSIFEETTIKKPFIGVQFSLGGSFSEEYIARSGERVSGSIEYTNNLAEQIRNGIIEISLIGSAIDKTSVEVDRGFYNSTTNTITWDMNTFSDLSIIDPGVAGRLSFSFIVRSASGSLSKNPTVNLSVNTRGERIGEGSTEEARGVAEKTIRLASTASLVARSVYFVGPFENTGPLPPKAEQTTTYTVIWTVSNSSNDLSGGTVRGFLPSYVSWKGVMSPVDAPITFNSATGEVLWTVGNVEAGTGSARPAKEVAFQIALTPSLTQIGKTPELMTGISFTARDNFTQSEVKVTRPNLTTFLSTDPEAPTKSSVEE